MDLGCRQRVGRSKRAAESRALHVDPDLRAAAEGDGRLEPVLIDCTTALAGMGKDDLVGGPVGAEQMTQHEHMEGGRAFVEQPGRLVVADQSVDHDGVRSLLEKLQRDMRLQGRHRGDVGLQAGLGGMAGRQGMPDRAELRRVRAATER